MRSWNLGVTDFYTKRVELLYGRLEKNLIQYGLEKNQSRFDLRPRLPKTKGYRWSSLSFTAKVEHLSKKTKNLDSQYNKFLTSFAFAHLKIIILQKISQKSS